jgi:hypothetical protein
MMAEFKTDQRRTNAVGDAMERRDGLRSSLRKKTLNRSSSSWPGRRSVDDRLGWSNQVADTDAADFWLMQMTDSWQTRQEFRKREFVGRRSVDVSEETILMDRPTPGETR